MGYIHARFTTVGKDSVSEIRRRKMGDFVQTMKEMRRMCAHFRPTCNGCPLCLEKGTNEFCGEQPLDIRSDPALVEASVMRWAAENPEPVYELWGEWFEKRGDLIRGWHNATNIQWIAKTFGRLMCTPIPADIAEKLGLQPKEGV